MKNKTSVSILAVIIAVFSILAASTGIFSREGTGSYPYTSIRGEQVNIYGIGLYRHMSAEVAIQGIAQDYVTLFVAVPLLLISVFLARRGSLKSRFVLAGVLNYFLVTYLFYLTMAMYNAMFLVYVVLLSASFFAFVLTVLSLDISSLPSCYTTKTPVKFTGSFLIFTAIAIAFLWLGIVVPPLLNHTIIPGETAHYTTLIVQGFDLSLMLPITFLSGWLLLKRNMYGYMMGQITILFLPLLMLALCAKIIAMATQGVNVIPVVFIIPLFFLVSLMAALGMTRNIRKGITC